MKKGELYLTRKERNALYKYVLSKIDINGRTHYLCLCLNMAIYTLIEDKVRRTGKINKRLYSIYSMSSALSIAFFPEIMKHKPVGKYNDQCWFENNEVRIQVLKQAIRDTR